MPCVSVLSARDYEMKPLLAVNSLRKTNMLIFHPNLEFIFRKQQQTESLVSTTEKQNHHELSIRLTPPCASWYADAFGHCPG